MKRALIIFVKKPEPGTVKTRLCPMFSADEAAEVYRAMADDIISLHAKGKGHDTIVCYAPEEAYPDIRTWLGEDLTLVSQVGPDLGWRQLNAFHQAFGMGYDKVVIIGTDCLDIRPRDLAMTWDAMERAELIVGPSDDGGYYLIGASILPTILSEDIRWGSEHVLRELLERAEQASITYGIIESKFDIDTFEDVKRFYTTVREMRGLNHVKNTVAVLRRLLEHPA